ncbi:hypothetical protein Ddye_008775 [Dipteronia dyeriana]|uniref:DUF1985 domain-containing protein n=1 Tax=Dipteronia dyeriana TaxID=168575 RepID=A0AAE0CM86_9ROSI|nr:hypothetical protein Ddye_008775 [Dipteronia dyeriana]
MYCFCDIADEKQELDNDGPTDEMWFLLGNHVVRFSKVELCFITGLRFGAVPDKSLYVAVENFIHEQYIPGADEVSLEELRVVLTLGEFQEAYDAVKLCLIYMLNWILMGVDKRLKIPVWQFQLVIFAFEVIPQLGIDFGAQRVTELSPRMLKWELTKQPRGKKLAKISVLGPKSGGSLYVEDNTVHLPTVLDQTSSAEGPDEEGEGVRCSEMEASDPSGPGFSAIDTD